MVVSGGARSASVWMLIEYMGLDVPHMDVPAFMVDDYTYTRAPRLWLCEPHQAEVTAQKGFGRAATRPMTR